MAEGSLPDDISTIIVGVVSFLSSFFTPHFVDRLGRRRLMLFISATGMILALFVLGLHFYPKTETSIDTSSLGWLPITCLLVFLPNLSLGFGPMPYAVIGELIKSLASAITASFGSIASFLVARFFQDIVDALGMPSAFWIFAECCVIANLFVYLLLPETTCWRYKKY